MVLGKLYIYMQRDKVRHLPHTIKNTNLKCSKDLNKRGKTLRALEET